MTSAACLEVGPKLKDFSSENSREFERVVRYFEPEPRGEGSESFIVWLLSLFNGCVIPVTQGSSLDLKGVDILLRGTGPTFGIQVKSSPGGMDIFKQKGNLNENILLLWVDTQKPESKRKIFALLFSFLKAQGITLREEVKPTLLKIQKLKKASILSLPIHRNRVSGFSSDELAMLSQLGYIQLKGGEYVIQ